MENMQFKGKRASLSAACLVLLAQSLSIPSYGQSTPMLTSAGKQAAPPARPLSADNEPDILLVMPNNGSDKQDVATALREAHGTVLKTIGSGDMTTLVVQCEKGQADEVAKKLGQDGEHFSKLQRNPRGRSQVASVAPVTTNDPDFIYEWHLSALSIPKAWNTSTGKGKMVCIADSGCQSNNIDLAGKTYPGYDYVSSSSTTYTANVDGNSGSHGTMMATIGAGIRNNRKLSAGASDAYIFPFKIAKETASGGTSTTDDVMISAIEQAGRNGFRALCISYGMSDTAQSYANPKAHPILHDWMKWYHDQKNGILIFSSGNDGKYDPSPRLPYMIMCSGITTGYKLANFSNYGPGIWFTGPACAIHCSDRNGKSCQIVGTSCVPPMLGGIIAMMLAQNSSLTNKQIEQRLINSCQNFTGEPNIEVGYGMPNAEKALGASSRALDNDDPLTAEASEPKIEGQEFQIEPVDPSALKFSDEAVKPTDSEEPTFH